MRGAEKMLMLKMMLRKSKTERVKMSWRKDCLRSKEDVMITYRVIRLPEKQRTHLPLVCACAYMHLFEIYFGSLLLCYKLCSLALLGPHAHRLHFACKIQNGRQGPKNSYWGLNNEGEEIVADNVVSH